MSWTRTWRERGITDVEYFKNDFFESDTVIHAHASVSNIFYAAIETPDEPGKIHAFVIAMRWNTRGYWDNFSYREFRESENPPYHTAPAKVLDVLTDTDHPYALAWRDKCRLRLEQRAFMKKYIREGDEVVFADPLRFTDKTSHDRFTIVRDLVWTGKTKIVLMEGDQRYRLPNWRDRTVTIIRDGAVEIPTPVGRRREEDEYVQKVMGQYRDYKDVINAHYGLTDRNFTPWDARTEFRTSGPWAGLDTLWKSRERVSA